MTVHTTITVPARRRRTRNAVSAIALVAAAIAIVAVVVVLATGGSKGAGSTGRPSIPAQRPNYDSAAMASIMALTPARFAAGALGTGYALAAKGSGPTLASVLASMSPSTRRYTRAVTSLTFAQLAAGAAGSP